MVKNECTCLKCKPHHKFKKEGDHTFTATLPYFEWISTLGACLICGAITFFYGVKTFVIAEALKFQGAPEIAYSEAMGSGVLSMILGLFAILLIGNLVGRAIKK